MSEVNKKRRLLIAGTTIASGLSGRVFKGVPVPGNLLIPPCHFKDDDIAVIGSSPSNKNV